MPPLPSPKVIIISSVSGGGKTTVIEHLKQRYSHLHIAITATTRPPRIYEKHGCDYYFYSMKEFEQMIEEKKFLEYATVYDNYYGIPIESVKESLEAGHSIILNIDVQGMQTVLKEMGKENSISIFILPPSQNIWKKRLLARDSEDRASIQKRLSIGVHELKYAKEYDLSVTNHILEETVNEISSFLIESGVLLESNNVAF